LSVDKLTIVWRYPDHSIAVSILSLFTKRVAVSFCCENLDKDRFFFWKDALFVHRR